MKKIAFILGFVVLLMSCQRENIDETEYPGQETKPNVTVVASVVGLLTEDNGQPLEDALVYLGQLQTTTNELGFFSFSDVLMSQNASYIQIEKDGYFNASRKFSTKLNATTGIRIQMVKNEIVGSIESTDGGEVEFDGSSVDLPAGTYHDINGQAYTGEVNVLGTWLDPTQAETYDQMPGELTGVDADGEQKVLASYGMMGVELVDLDGNYLSLPEGETATISMPIPAEILGSAPSTIPLWYFNEVSGTWEEEGEANLIDGHYVGEVAHFTFWNCDVPFPLVEILGYIDLNNIPYEGAQLKITDLSSGFCAFGYTGERGFFSGKVPEGSDLLLQVMGPCGLPIEDIVIEAMYTDQSLNTINLESDLETVVVSGNVENCDGDELEQGYVLLNSGSFVYTISLEDDGSFYQEFPGCSTDTTVDIFGVDVTNSLVSAASTHQFEGDILGISLIACHDYFEPGIHVSYNGKNWSINDSISLAFGLDVLMNIGTDEGYQYSLLGIDIENFNNGVFIANFLNIPGETESSYEIDFATHGFSINGICETSLITQLGTEYIRFKGVFDEEPFVYDNILFPGNIGDVIFDISFAK